MQAVINYQQQQLWYREQQHATLAAQAAQLPEMVPRVYQMMYLRLALSQRVKEAFNLSLG
jgi:hypothetical protein